MKHTFSSPVNFEGTEYKDLDLDLDGLKGTDISAVKREWAAAGNFSPVPSTDLDFCAMIAARAAKQPVEMIEDLPAKEYTKICQAVSNFLMA